VRSIFAAIVGCLVTVSVAPAQPPDTATAELEEASEALTAALSRLGRVYLNYDSGLRISWEVSNVSLRNCVLQGTLRTETGPPDNQLYVSEFKRPLWGLDVSSIRPRVWEPTNRSPYRPAGRQAWNVAGVPINRRSDAERVAELLRAAAVLCGAE
jgi:hypothetical protein